MTENIENMTFEDYVLSIKIAHTAFRKNLCAKLGISEKTYYNKYKANSWTNAEREIISQILNRPVYILFPEKRA